MSTIDNKIEQIKAAIYEDFKRSGEVVFNGLLENPPIGSIPESAFVHYFLGYFLGDKTDNPNWAAEWISVAGTPMSEVNVIHDITKEVLFKVPALLQTKNLSLDSQSGGYTAIFSRYEQITNNIPTSGTRFLVAALDDKEKELLRGVDMEPAYQTWREILMRYGVIKEAAALQQQSGGSIDDMFDI